VNEFQSDELEATALETTNDVANESPLDTVGLKRQRRDNQRSGEAGTLADRVP